MNILHKRNGCTVLEHYTELKNWQTLILSMPLVLLVNIHEDYYSIIEYCRNNKINVLLDCAYINISGIGDIDVDILY